METYLKGVLQYDFIMLILKVAGDIEYKIEKLQDGIKVSDEIPKFVIKCSDDEK